MPYGADIYREYGDGAFFASGIIEQGLEAFDKNLWAACDCLLGVGEPIEQASWIKREWITAAIKFSDSHFDGEVRTMTYCLKDIYNLKMWEKLSKEYKDVDWKEMSEQEDNIDFGQESACAGGACEMPEEYLEALRGTNNK